MAFKTLGGTIGYLNLAVANQAYRITANQSQPTAKYSCHTLFIQQHPANTNIIYLADRADPNITSGVGILAAIPAPTLTDGIGTLIPWLAVTIPYAPGGLNAANYYLISASASQKAIVSAVVA